MEQIKYTTALPLDFALRRERDELRRQSLNAGRPAGNRRSSDRSDRHGPGQLPKAMSPRWMKSKAISGIEFLRRIADGRLPQPPITRPWVSRLAEVAPGFALFTMTPQFRQYNPIGTVHGGVAATLLDSCMSCAVQTHLEAGLGYTTLETQSEHGASDHRKDRADPRGGPLTPRRPTFRARRRARSSMPMAPCSPTAPRRAWSSRSTLASLLASTALASCPRASTAPRSAAGSGQVKEHERVRSPPARRH